MERRSGRSNIGQVPNGPVGGENADVLQIIQTMLGNQQQQMNNQQQFQQQQMNNQQQQMQNQQQQMEHQQQQTELLRQELTAPKEPKPGNVSDFRRLQPAVFTGSEEPLEAEQWLTDTTDPVSYTHLTLPTIYSV